MAKRDRRIGAVGQAIGAEVQRGRLVLIRDGSMTALTAATTLATTLVDEMDRAERECADGLVPYKIVRWGCPVCHVDYGAVDAVHEHWVREHAARPVTAHEHGHKTRTEE